MVLYELLALGSPTSDQLAALKARAAEAAASFELTFPGELTFRTAAEVAGRDLQAATAALFFGGDPAVDAALIAELQHAKTPIVPVIDAGADFTASIPHLLHATNGYRIPAGDVELEALAAVWLECVGLLHVQRRVFVSYRRSESRAVAVQLHDQLSARNFDVFLDTHDIRPGQPFQDRLWHRLVDCDVVIMLDTPDYFNSKWTTQEVGRALAKGIHVLRLIWPGHVPSRHLQLADPMSLAISDFETDGSLRADVVGTIIQRTERLRSRSVATRHLEMAGKLRIEVERMGGHFEGVGAHRSMSLSLPSGARIWAYPVVGVPTAELLNDVYNKVVATAATGSPFLVYDHVGIQDVWLEHLRWLNEHIAAVKALRVMDAAWELVAWDS